MFFKVLLSFETVFHAQSRQNIKFLVEEEKQMQKTFLTSFSSIPWPRRRVHCNCIQTKILKGKQILFKTFQIDPLLMFLFICVKDNLFLNFPFQLNAMFVHGNCRYRMSVNFEGDNFVYEQVITTNYIR